jgi:cytochrome c2
MEAEEKKNSFTDMCMRVQVTLVSMQTRAKFLHCVSCHGMTQNLAKYEGDELEKVSERRYDTTRGCCYLEITSVGNGSGCNIDGSIDTS